MGKTASQRLSIAGRGLFVALLFTQCVLLVEYVVKYEGKSGNFRWLLVLLIPGLLAGVCSLLAVILERLEEHNGGIRWLWLVWLLYTWIALTPLIGLIFGSTVIENKLNNDSFLGPNVLKSTLCITPVLMLLLLKSTPDTMDILNVLSFTVTLDLFDGIEMLEVILEEDETPRGIRPKELEVAILACVCVFFFLSPLELFRFKFEEDGEHKPRKRVLYVRSIFQMLVNLVFLILRSVLWVGYGRNASIFITKNGISLTLLVLEVWPKCYSYMRRRCCQ